MLSTDEAWKKWGREDPYYGVLSHDRFRANVIGEHRNEFFDSGRATVDHVLAQHEQQFGPSRRSRALDHGCGVGRLSLPLAHHFDEVVALDVSPDMLSEGAANAAEAGLTNIRFAAADDGLKHAPGTFDFVMSLMVLQHIPVRRGLGIIDALADRVAPGGGFYIHLSIRTDRGFPRWLYWASANIPGVKLWQNIDAGRPWNAPAMQMNDYPLDRIMKRLAGRGFEPVIVDRETYPRFVTLAIAGRRPAD